MSICFVVTPRILIDDSNDQKDNESLASYISIPLGFVGAVSIIALLIIHGMKGINKFLLIANQMDIFFKFTVKSEKNLYFA